MENRDFQEEMIQVEKEVDKFCSDFQDRQFIVPLGPHEQAFNNLNYKVGELCKAMRESRILIPEGMGWCDRCKAKLLSILPMPKVE